MNTKIAAKIERAGVRQTMLRNILPQDLAPHITVARGGNVFLRGVLVGGFTDDGAHIVGWEDRDAPVPIDNARGLEALFRGVFFPADYTGALAARDAHEALMAAYAAGDDAAVQGALKWLRALEAPIAAA